MLSGHIDTVSPDYQKYKTNPFELTEIDGKCYGLGSIDMKSFVAVILDKLEEIKRLNVPIVLSLTTDEETNLFCIENVINKFKELDIRPRFTLVGEPTSSEIKTTANGCFEYCVEVFGKSCHSSVLENGINSICIVAKLITYIENLQKQFNGLTSNCGIVSGGDIINRVPDYAKLKFDVRSTDIKDINEFIILIKNKINELQKEYMSSKITIEKELEIPPLKCENLTIKKLSKKTKLKVGKFNGGCEAGYYQQYSGDAVLFGVGDLNLAHKPNEFVEIEEYKFYSNKLIEFLKCVKNEYFKLQTNELDFNFL